MSSSSFIRWFIFVVFSSAVLAVPETLFKIRDKVERHRRQIIAQSVQKLGTSAFEGTSQFFVAQLLDHFDASEQRTYKQRVYVNNKYWKSGGPIFLFIGGEGSLSIYDVMGGQHVEMAQTHGALVFAVEHRYYGASINEDGLKLENLAFLSSQQALADLASFYDYAMHTYNLTPSNTWICFGGSYPGALSAWFRIKYPHIVYGAIASSAPVEAQVNFIGYNDVVAQSLQDPVVNGSSQCYRWVLTAFEQIGQSLTDQKYSQLQEDFLSCNGISSPADTVQFVTNLAGVVMGIVQYNEQLEFQNISTLCTYMTDLSLTPYQRLAAFNKKLLEMTGEKCSDNSWSGFLDSLSNTTVDQSAAGVGLRQWIYQTCTQFGYYQTCSDECPFSHLMDLESNLKICEEVFEISGAAVKSRVSFTNDFYGSNNPKGSRIVFVNGSIDPWHALSVLRNQTTEETAIFINGSSHCQNMGPDLARDSPALREAKQEIREIVAGWLQNASKESLKTVMRI